jgi:hypothetical protein
VFRRQFTGEPEHDLQFITHSSPLLSRTVPVQQSLDPCHSLVLRGTWGAYSPAPRPKVLPVNGHRDNASESCFHLGDCIFKRRESEAQRLPVTDSTPANDAMLGCIGN